MKGQAIVIEDSSKQMFEDKVNHYLEKFEVLGIEYSRTVIAREGFFGRKNQNTYSAIIIFKK